MIDKPSPSFEMALQEEFKRFYLAGIETGRRLERELMQQTRFDGKLQENKTNGLYEQSCTCARTQGATVNPGETLATTSS